MSWRKVPFTRIVGWEARLVDAEGATRSLEAARCDGHEVELTTYLRTPQEDGDYRVELVMKLADGTRTAPLFVTRFIVSSAGSP